MIDADKFATRFRARLLDLAAAGRGVAGIEAYRQWQTNPNFKAQIEAVIAAAVQALDDPEDQGVDERYAEIFSREANTLLGWDETLGRWDH